MKKFAHISLLLISVILMSCDDKKVVVTNSIKGTWRCEEYNPLLGGSRVYMVDIERSSTDTTKYLLSNFNNEGVDSEGNQRFVIAHLKKFTLTIDPSQQIFGTQTLVKTSTGTVSTDFSRINLTSQIYNGVSDFTIQSVYTRP